MIWNSWICWGYLAENLKSEMRPQCLRGNCARLFAAELYTVWSCFHGEEGLVCVCVCLLSLCLSLSSVITLIYGCLSTHHSASVILSLDGSWWFVFLSVIGFIQTDPTHCVSCAVCANEAHITRREAFACFCDKLSNFREKVLSGSAPTF